jgi:hypothetical protein
MSGSLVEGEVIEQVRWDDQGPQAGRQRCYRHHTAGLDAIIDTANGWSERSRMRWEKTTELPRMTAGHCMSHSYCW